MSEDTLDKITSLIEAEANEDLVFPVQNENRNPNERVMEGLYQKKQTNSIGMFKRQHNFAFPKTPVRPVASEMPSGKNNISFGNGDFQRPHTFNKNQKGIALQSPQMECSESDLGKCSGIEDNEVEGSLIDGKSATISVETKNDKSQETRQFPAFNSAINKMREQLAVMECTMTTDDCTIEKQKLEIKQLSQAINAQSDSINDAIREVSDAQVLLDSQLKIMQEQHDNLASLTKIKQEMQVQITLIEEVMKENRIFIYDSNEKLMKLVDECQHWKSQSAKMQREIGTLETKYKTTIENLETKIESKEKELVKLEGQFSAEKETSQIEIICLRKEKDVIVASFNEANANLKELKRKINRIADEVTVEYSAIMSGEGDIEAIFSNLENFHRQKSVENRTAMKKLEFTIERLTEEMQRRDQKIAQLEKVVESKSCNHEGEIDKLQESIASLQDKNDLLEKDLNDLNTMATTLREKNQKLHLKLQESQLNSTSKTVIPSTGEEEQISKLKEELEKRSTDISECIKLKNAEIENLKKYYQSMIEEKEAEITKLSKKRKIESEEQDNVAEIIQDIGREISNQPATPPSQQSKHQIELKKTKKSADKISRSFGSNGKRRSHSTTENSSVTTASLSHYAQRYVGNQRKLLTTDSDDYFQN